MSIVTRSATLQRVGGMSVGVAVLANARRGSSELANRASIKISCVSGFKGDSASHLFEVECRLERYFEKQLDKQLE